MKTSQICDYLEHPKTLFTLEKGDILWLVNGVLINMVTVKRVYKNTSIVVDVDGDETKLESSSTDPYFEAAWQPNFYTGKPKYRAYIDKADADVTVRANCLEAARYKLSQWVKSECPTEVLEVILKLKKDIEDSK
jgi:hypothetical protein